MSKHLEADSCAQAQELCGISAKARRWESGYQRALTQTVRGLQGILKTTYSKAMGTSDKASFTDPSKNHSSALLAPGPKLWGQLSIRVPDWTHGPYVQGFSHYCLRESGQQGRSQARTTPKVTTRERDCWEQGSSLSAKPLMVMGATAHTCKSGTQSPACTGSHLTD